MPERMEAAPPAAIPEQSQLRGHRELRGTSMTDHESSTFKMARWQPRCNRTVAEGPVDLVWKQKSSSLKAGALHTADQPAFSLMML